VNEKAMRIRIPSARVLTTVVEHEKGADDAEEEKECEATNSKGK